ncbi:MAG: phospholipase [Cytophagia bacterium]|nr:MAG: phospholipase [Runella sp.]TAG19628.1 MAG: phospholipase [Cytophagales bacterium]TAG40211.1 MAG: phospholipase [Cytophagia bacterium]TAG68095.1 MAG: phospholipase [Runella slithyformis]TAG80422.1 MAG: phospholipase [Cytophagales bacterium]
MKSFFRLSSVLLIALPLLFIGCKTTEPAAPENKYLVSNSVIGSFTKAQLTTQLTTFDPTLASFLRNGIKVYKVIYKTKNTDGAEIQASGVVLIPDVPSAVPMVSVQHGTIFDDADAPSNYNPNTEASTVGALFSSLGYILVYPDYIGFGASKNVPHPYEHRESLGTACLDMIRAAKELVTQEKAQWDERLYIGGYSQGGGATMALQKKIEEETGSEFNLRASSCGAGAYDKTAFMNFLINSKSSADAQANRFYLWVLLTYDRIYKLNRPMTAYFKEPFATQIAATKERTTITVSFDQILTDTFKSGVKNNTDAAFMAAVKDNDVFDWKPRTPTRLYHGDADVTVYPFTSQNAFNAMQKRGATNVQIMLFPGKNHATAIQDYLLGTLSFVLSTQ